MVNIILQLAHSIIASFLVNQSNLRITLKSIKAIINKFVVLNSWSVKLNLQSLYTPLIIVPGSSGERTTNLLANLITSKPNVSTNDVKHISASQPSAYTPPFYICYYRAGGLPYPIGPLNAGISVGAKTRARELFVLKVLIV